MSWEIFVDYAVDEENDYPLCPWVEAFEDASTDPWDKAETVE